MNQQFPIQHNNYFFKSIVTFLLSTIAYSVSYNAYSSNYIFGGLATVTVIILLVASPFYFILGLLEFSQSRTGLID